VFVWTGERKAIFSLLSICESASSSKHGGLSKKSKILMLQTLKFCCQPTFGSNPFKAKTEVARFV
jgi:hypothetical protein